MIIEAKHNFIISPFFRWYTRHKLKRNFSKVLLLGSFTDKNLPVLMLANHVSWWDGFWAMYLNLNLLKRNFYFMMLEEQLKKFWFFNYTGGFSVRKGGRQILESLAYTAKLLANPKTMVLIFAQGKIQSMHQHTFKFEKGISRILEQAPKGVQVLMVANLTDYFSNPKPTLYIYYQEFTSERYDHAALEAAYNRFYANCLAKQCQIPDQP